MRAVVFEGVGQVAVRDVPDAVVEQPRDAVLRVTRAGLCGSDLHPYRGHEPARAGVVAGHEAVGVVVAVGVAVRDWQVGDRVLAAFTTSCGRCKPCRAGMTARCDTSILFGWGDPDDPSRILHGGQAELLRVPEADGTLVVVPDGWSDDDAVLLADNLPTGWEAVTRTGLRPGETLAVVGCGSVGLHAVHAALVLGAGAVVAVDPVAARQAVALDLGARRPRAGETFPRVVEAVGNPAAQRAAFDLVAPGGILSLISVPTAPGFTWTAVEAYDRNLVVAAGRANVRAGIAALLASGPVTRPPTAAVVTHPGLPLDRAAEVYARFAAAEGGLVKATFAP